MYLAIDIGGTNIQYAHMNSKSQMILSWEVKTPSIPDTEGWYDYLYTHAKPESNYLGIGVSLPGVILDNGDVISKASFKVRPLYQSNIKKELNRRFNAPVSALNDGKAAALCEVMMGSAKASASSVSFIIGTAIGGGLTYDQEVINGHDGFAGEFSSILVHYNNQEVNLSQVASAYGLSKHYHKESGIWLDEAKDIFDLYHELDPHAIKAMEIWVDWIAFGLYQLTTIFNPEIFCLGGGVTKDPILLPLVQKSYFEIMKDLNSVARVGSRIVLCSSPSQANLYGAMLHFFKKHGS